MIKILDKVDCCGCWACENVCPKQCITMTEDNEGFRYPVVDVDTCIQCGLCEKVCPIINPNPRKENKPAAYLVQNRNPEVLRESTSGGAFTAIASWVIKQGGIVYGAAFGEDQVVRHIGVERIEDLRLFRNSKYVQSQITHTFSEALEHLKAGRQVCFSGTPCQIEGLKKYLRRRYDNLLTVDVVCRAVPSPLVLRKYTEMQEARFDQKPKIIKFRDKWYGYKYSAMTLSDKRGRTFYHEGIDTDSYLRAFFSGMSFRPSCSDCRFRPDNRVSDFTIWDCFDVYKFSKTLDNDKGVTRILAHNSKAAYIMSQLSDDLIIEGIPYDKAVEGVMEFIESPKVNPLREQFFEALNTRKPAVVFKEYFPNTLRHRIEKQARIISNKLGIYKQMKRLFKRLHGDREIKR